MPVISGGQMKRMLRFGAGSLPSAISRARVTAVSISAAAPEALSCAPGCGWHRWLTSRISSPSAMASPGSNASTTSIAPG